MTIASNPYRGFRYPREVIQQAPSTCWESSN